MGLRMAAQPLEGGRYFVLWPVDAPLASCGQRFVVDAYSQGALFLLDEVPLLTRTNVASHMLRHTFMPDDDCTVRWLFLDILFCQHTQTNCRITVLHCSCLCSLVLDDSARHESGSLRMVNIGQAI